jgi:hypothetical protein
MFFWVMLVSEFMRPNSHALVHPVTSLWLDHSVISLSLRHVGVKDTEFTWTKDLVIMVPESAKRMSRTIMVAPGGATPPCGNVSTVQLSPTITQ